MLTNNTQGWFINLNILVKAATVAVWRKKHVSSAALTLNDSRVFQKNKEVISSSLRARCGDHRTLYHLKPDKKNLHPQL